jgi:cobalt-zinc-cadmium efflux system outer membrane protein
VRFLVRIGALLLVARAASGAPLGLAQALSLAAERAPDALAAGAQVPIAKAEVRSAGMLQNPTLTVAGARAEPVFSSTLAVRLPIFGQRGAKVRAAEFGVDQARAEAKSATWHLRHDARVAYYAAARADEEVAIAEAIEKLTGEVADKARERFEVGMGTRLEAGQAALVHTRAMQEISDRRAAAKVARLELARLCGLAADAIDALEDPLERFAGAPSLPSLLAEAARRHPELLALDAERVAAQSRAGAARAELRPAPVVELGVDLLEPATCNPMSPTGRCAAPRGALSFDLPFLNWNGGPVAVAEAEARAAEAKREAVRNRVAATVREAWENLAAAIARARFFDAEYLPSARTVEAMAREGFASGKTGLLPLIEAQRAMLEARLGRAGALFAVQSARADLEEASGVILDAQ